jgi:ribose-phosphate pyrophosphokinase
MMDSYKIAAGSSNLPLAEKVAKSIGKQLAEVKIKKFSDGEIWVKYEENIRGIDLFIIQSTNPPADNIMELLMLIDAAKRASAKSITVVIPYFGYARQDRKDQPRVSITARLVADLLETAGADRVITFDLHSSQIQGFFGIPLDNLYASPVIIKKLLSLGMNNMCASSPDAGGVKTARSYADRLGGIDLAVVHKRRPSHNEAVITNVIGDVQDKNMILIDDMIDTGGTFLRCAEALVSRGAKSITGVCVHPVLSGEAVKKIAETDALDKLYVTDTIELKETCDKIEVISIADMLAEAIKRTFDNRSISSLFDIER